MSWSAREAVVGLMPACEALGFEALQQTRGLIRGVEAALVWTAFK